MPIKIFKSFCCSAVYPGVRRARGGSRAAAFLRRKVGCSPHMLAAQGLSGPIRCLGRCFPHAPLLKPLVGLFFLGSWRVIKHSRVAAPTQDTASLPRRPRVNLLTFLPRRLTDGLARARSAGSARRGACCCRPRWTRARGRPVDECFSEFCFIRHRYADRAIRQSDVVQFDCSKSACLPVYESKKAMLRKQLSVDDGSRPPIRPLSTQIRPGHPCRAGAQGRRRYGPMRRPAANDRGCEWTRVDTQADCLPLCSDCA